jgi:type I restriction enzyme S subunit
LQNAESPEEFGRQWAQVCDAFDLILDCPENVSVLRQTVLQLAVQGQLVRQEPEDEPARKLVERIRKEKNEVDNSMMKNLNDYTGGKQPFSIPNNWTFIKLHQICKNITDGDHQPPPKITKGVPFIVISNISDGKLDLNTMRYVTKEYFDQITESRKPHFGDILYTVTGSYGIPVIVNVEKEFCFQRHIGLIKPSKNIDLRYLFWTLKSPLTFEQSQKSCTGIAQPTVSLGSLRNFVIPLPPLAEQHRIVAKIDALMALCDELEARLKERARVQGRLAEVVSSDTP